MVYMTENFNNKKLKMYICLYFMRTPQNKRQFFKQKLLSILHNKFQIIKVIFFFFKFTKEL